MRQNRPFHTTQVMALSIPQENIRENAQVVRDLQTNYNQVVAKPISVFVRTACSHLLCDVWNKLVSTDLLQVSNKTDTGCNELLRACCYQLIITYEIKKIARVVITDLQAIVTRLLYSYCVTSLEHVLISPCDKIEDGNRLLQAIPTRQKPVVCNKVRASLLSSTCYQSVSCRQFQTCWNNLFQVCCPNKLVTRL